MSTLLHRAKLLTRSAGREVSSACRRGCCESRGTGALSRPREGGGQKVERVCVIDWDDPAVKILCARSRVKLTIEDVLDQGLPRAYTPDLYKQKCAAVFEHVYETYGDRGHSIYGIVG